MFTLLTLFINIRGWCGWMPLGKFWVTVVIGHWLVWPQEGLRPIQVLLLRVNSDLIRCDNPHWDPMLGPR